MREEEEEEREGLPHHPVLDHKSLVNSNLPEGAHQILPVCNCRLISFDKSHLVSHIKLEINKFKTSLAINSSLSVQWLILNAKNASKLLQRTLQKLPLYSPSHVCNRLLALKV